MKLTRKILKEIIKEELNELGGFSHGKSFDIGSPYGKKGKGMGNPQYKGYSSKEAKKVVDDGLRDYAKILRKAQYKVIKDWLSKAKSGAVDYFDLVRGFNTGDISRAYPYETKFLMSILNKDKILNRFRSYFKGKKGMRNR